DDDDDDAPVEVSKEISKQQAKENFKQEKSAKNFIDEKLKQKRRRELERNVEQKKLKIEKLPEDFLEELDAELSTVITTESSDKNIPTVDAAILKKKKRERKKLAKTKTLTTQATKYEILSLNELAKTTQPPIIQTTACNFREQILFDKNRYRRQTSRKMVSNYQKRRASLKK
ncbi:hypothetical protein BLA29_006608, partial [Euroglyphus maynei]